MPPMMSQEPQAQVCSPIADAPLENRAPRSETHLNDTSGNIETDSDRTPVTERINEIQQTESFNTQIYV